MLFDVFLIHDLKYFYIYWVSSCQPFTGRLIEFTQLSATVECLSVRDFKTFKMNHAILSDKIRKILRLLSFCDTIHVILMLKTQISLEISYNFFLFVNYF